MIAGGRRKRRLAGAMIMAPALFLVGCDSNTAGGDSPSIVAVVNGSPITRKDMCTAMMVKGGSCKVFGGNEDLGRAIVEELVERRLILQRSRIMGGFIEEDRVRAFVRMMTEQYGSPEELDKILREEEIDIAEWKKALRETLEIEQMLDREVYSRIKIGAEEVSRVYRENPKRYRIGRRWRVRQIMVGSEEEAKRLRGRIVDGVPFSRLARQASHGPERQKGGDMGLFTEGQFPERVEKVIRDLKEGEISGVVQTSSGFHLFQVTETRSGGMQPFRAVREEIRSELLAKKSRKNLKRWLAGLKEKSEIHYYWRNLNDRAAG